MTLTSWYRKAMESEPSELNSLIEGFKAQIPGLDLWAYETNEKVELKSIRIPIEQRNQGIGGQIIEAIKEYARKVGKPVVLSPQPERGRTKDLERFYKEHGFLHNRGKNKDYSISSFFGPTMYWRP